MNTIAQTTSGPVQGRSKDDVLLFAGIPYAAPPVGALRFRAAAPHPGWTEVRDATRFGPAAPQLASNGFGEAPPPRWREDCLTLNISTPALDDARRPVLVWIHGGAYRTGQSAVPWYNGARFSANGDIVVVSINYRLGALGFTDLSRFGEQYATSGINGTLDQIAALEWVRDNIAHFGGDPARVTIAGESAGAFSVTTLLASPRAAGLFRAVIAQSGAGHHALSPSQGALVADTFLEHLGAGDPLALQSADAEAVLAAQARTIAALETPHGQPSRLGPVGAFYPVFGNPVLPKLPIEMIRDGQGAGVALLTGTNADETTMWLDSYAQVTPESLASAYGAPALADAYRSTRPDATDLVLSIALSTDLTFRIPAIRMAEARAAGPAGTWLYEFNWKSRMFEGRLGATHALEIPFAFDNLDRGGVDAFIGEGPLPQHVADTMHAAWTSFIRQGEADWPRYDTATRATMVFGDTAGVELNPRAAEREVWRGIR